MHRPKWSNSRAKGSQARKSSSNSMSNHPTSQFLKDSVEMGNSPSTHSLAKLPIQVTSGGHDLILDRLGLVEVPAVYQLICCEACEGQDMGQDEFASEQHLQTHILKADSFRLSDTHTGQLVSAILLSPSMYSRSTDPLLVDGIIICDTNIKSNIIQALIQLTEKLAIALNYEGLLVEAFRISSLVEMLRSEGFSYTGCICNSGKLINKGWTDSLIMYKELQKRNPEIKNRLEGEEVVKIAFSVQRPRLTFLPKLLKTPLGKKVIVRYMQDDEISHVYRMYKEASDKGNGFSTDEFNTMEAFRYYVIDHGHAFVIEDPITWKILEAFTITPSEFCRSVNPQNCTGFIVVDPGSQGMQLGTLGSALFETLGSELGYTGCNADPFVTNLGMIRAIRKNGYIISGLIPKAANGQNNRLEDVYLMYKSYEDKSRFIPKL